METWHTRFPLLGFYLIVIPAGIQMSANQLLLQRIQIVFKTHLQRRAVLKLYSGKKKKGFPLTLKGFHLGFDTFSSTYMKYLYICRI